MRKSAQVGRGEIFDGVANPTADARRGLGMRNLIHSTMPRKSAWPEQVTQGFARACGEPLTTAMAKGYTARQMFDLPEPTPQLVAGHRVHDCRRIICGTQTRAAFPKGVTAPAQSDKRIGAFVLYLLHDQCCRKSASPY